MSKKQFISADAHLAKLGITKQQAYDFIFANLDRPEIIYAAAREYGVTHAMLHEITDVPVIVIDNYFIDADFDPGRLDHTSILFNTDIGSLETLVDLNGNTGILSTASLREKVQPLINFSTVYDFPFTARYGFQLADGIYDADELGVSRLGDIAATDGNIESIFYGTLINMFSRFDQAELDQIKTFPENGNPEDFQALLSDALNDAPATSAWTDEELLDLVVDEAVYLHNHYINDSFVIGLFDHSYLGYAPVIH
ncbi:MAG: hypothetical protein KF888_07660 [Nitrosomonas sp.]|nr:hypothetical protein [Nitrosomonas sp.]